MSPSHRTLQLLRHAKSDWNATYGSDLTRPLSSRGRRAARTMANWMKNNGVTQDIVYTSPATRTQQTLEVMKKEISFQEVQVVDDLYHADLDTFLAILGRVPREYRKIMLVGHNPGMEDLLLYLCAADLEQTAGKLFPTAAFASIHLPDDWDSLSAHTGRLLTLVRPRELDLE